MTKTFLLFILFFPVLMACNNQVAEGKKNAAPTLALADQQILGKCYQYLSLTLKMAEEAVNRSTTPDAKQLAQTIVQEHKQMMDELEVIAGRHQVELPLDISPAQTKQWQLLVHQKGISFDKFYTNEVQRNQEGKVFTEMSESAVDRNLRSAAKKFSAMADQHVRQAVAVQETLANRRSRDTISFTTQITQNP